ncbi:MAG: ATP-binding cassette domain-containing protein [Nostocoides sp.]
MIEATALTKRYGDKLAVDDLSFVVHPGVVTGFLGPNGAGKSTTMRMIMGLDSPTSGSVTVNGMAYRSLRDPLREVGALLEAKSIHSGRSAFNHLLALAQTAGIGRARVNEVIDLVGIAEVARKRAGGFSLGMSQRLGIASALLGDPHTLILDEPVNGLDPDGIRWIRNLLKHLAAEGRTIFVSSHLMSEMAQTAEHLIVIGRGRLIADTSVSEIIARASGQSVLVRTTDVPSLLAAVAGPEVQTSVDDQGAVTVHGLTTDEVGVRASREGVTLLELTAQRVTLEDAFMDLTKDSVEYHGHEADEPAQLATSGVGA